MSVNSIKMEYLSEICQVKAKISNWVLLLDRKRVSHYRSPLCASPSHLLATFSWTDEEQLAAGMRCWWDELGGEHWAAWGSQQYGPCRAVGQLSGTYGGCQAGRLGGVRQQVDGSTLPLSLRWPPLNKCWCCCWQTGWSHTHAEDTRCWQVPTRSQWRELAEGNWG